MIKKIKRKTKKSIYSILNRTIGSCIILLYHRVNDLKDDPQQLTVGVANFEKQIEFLSKNYNTISVDEFLTNYKQKNKFPKNSVLITFDDGYADNFHNALPTLEKNNTQAIFYISTALLNTNNVFWWDNLEWMFNNNSFKQGFDNPKNPNLKYINDYNSAINHFKTLDQNNQKSFMENLIRMIDYNKVEYENFKKSRRMLNTDEIISLSKSPCAIIGAHTKDHVKLSNLCYDEQFNQINESKLNLESILNLPINHFSYPYGTKEDYNEDTLSILTKCKFEMVCSNYNGIIFPDKKINPFYKHKILELPRYLVRDWEFSYFKDYIKNIIN